MTTKKPEQPARLVKCPTCGTATAFAPANRWRPFCSERCRLIDLGEWMDEEKRIAGDPEYTDPDMSSEARSERD